MSALVDDLLKQKETLELTSDFVLLGQITLPAGAVKTHVYYSKITDLVLYKHNGVYSDSVSVLCIATLPEPYQTNLRKQLGLLK